MVTNHARVWDHCHVHGLIRGVLCARHNRLIGLHQHEAYEHRCPGCAGQLAQLAAPAQRESED